MPQNGESRTPGNQVQAPKQHTKTEFVFQKVRLDF
jgi:hypothetical protein